MDDASELLWRMYTENMTHVRHIETQRSTITSVLLTLSGAILAVIAVQLRENRVPHWSLSILLMLIGVVGLVFTAKLYELYTEHKERARTYRKALAKRIPTAQIEELKEDADRRWKKDVPWVRFLPVHMLWMGPHFSTVLLGAIILATTLSRPSAA